MPGLQTKSLTITIVSGNDSRLGLIKITVMVNSHALSRPGHLAETSPERPWPVARVGWVLGKAGEVLRGAVEHVVRK